MENDELLKRRLKDLASQADRRGIYTFSGFLNLSEQDLFMSLKKEFPLPASLYGLTDSGERRIAVFGSEEFFGYPPEYPLTVLRISPLSEKFSEDLTHRDYLGAVLNTGIERSLTGDIVIREHEAFLICLDSIADHLCSSLDRIRHTSVRVQRCESDIPELLPKLEEVRFNVASERLDAVVAAFINQSRTKASLLFQKELVFVNSRAVTDTSARLREGDVLNVRGFGKAVYRGIDGTSRKGRLYVVLDKYI